MSRNRKPPTEDNYRTRFAARLKELREKAGMDVDQFAKLMLEEGVISNRRTVYHWESAAGFPKIDYFPIIAKTLKLKSVRTLLPKE